MNPSHSSSTCTCLLLNVITFNNFVCCNTPYLCTEMKVNGTLSKGSKVNGYTFNGSNFVISFCLPSKQSQFLKQSAALE